MYYQKLLGQKIGNWTVLGVDEHGANKHTKMLCRCDCGRIRSVDAYSLYHGLTSSCGKCNRIVSEGDHKRCIMKNGASFIFDPEDELLVRRHTWSVSRGYVRTDCDGKQMTLHRMLIEASPDDEVDHINMDRMDNRRCNLRISTHAGNNQNKGLRSDNTTGFKGVCFDKRSGKYIAYINADGQRTYLGYFDNKIDAAKAYDAAAIELHGEFARLNFGEEGVYGNTEVLAMAQ